ncbi:MAG TPA: hypothetical protein VN651_16715, partial [Gemmatimonadaceae bacterium]|nr:hypothetical protein [Gemmatimonadaceae bacterium]
VVLGRNTMSGLSLEEGVARSAQWDEMPEASRSALVWSSQFSKDTRGRPAKQRWRRGRRRDGAGIGRQMDQQATEL